MSRTETILKGDLAFLQEPFYLDVEVEIGGQKCLYNKAILAWKSITIRNLLKDVQGKEISLSIDGIKPEYIKTYLDSLFNPNISLVENPLPFVYIADYLEVKAKRCRALKEMADAYLETKLVKFANSYRLPFTELSEEVKSILTYAKHPKIKNWILNACNKTMVDKSLEKLASAIHIMLTMGWMNVDWVAEQLLARPFPKEFIEKLELPYHGKYIIEGKIQHDLVVRPIISKKRKGDEMVPLDNLDKAYLKRSKITISQNFIIQ